MPTISMFYGIVICLYFLMMNGISFLIYMQNIKGRKRHFQFLMPHC